MKKHLSIIARATIAVSLAVLPGLGGTPSALVAQTIHVTSSGETRFDAGGGLEYAQPVGQFRQNVRQGFGGDGYIVFALDPQGIVGIRVDAGIVNYGNQTEYVPVSSTIRFITLGQETSNNIFVASIGPQLAVKSGPVRPYVNAGIGFAYFYTQSSLKNSDDEELASNTNYSDNSLAYTLGGGVLIPISSGRAPISLDVGARYQDIGTTRYLARGDIQDDPGSETGILITPRESEARYVAYHLGINVHF